MKLYFKGHEYKYAVEQIMFTVFPDARSEFSETGPLEDDDFAVVTLSRGEKMVTAHTELRYRGRNGEGYSKVMAGKLKGKIETDRELQRIIKLSFFRAAMRILDEKPAWGALTGIRPGTIFTKMVEKGASEKEAVGRMRREYFVSKERALLCADTLRHSLRVKGELGKKDIALYIGIPFCPTRCAYCSFVSQSVERSMKLIPGFLAALETEIRATAQTAKALGLRVVAVYMGGGTPTTLSAEELKGLIAVLRENFDLSAVREFCVEAGRPDTITEEKLAALRAGGVDRISINPQTMSDRVLEAIGRKHTAEDIREAFGAARRVGGFDINMDLIAGLPADTVGTFGKTLKEVIGMEPENITVHTLALKRGTKITLEGTERPDKAAVSEMVGLASRELRRAGYEPYYLYRQKFMSGGFENVGWCKKGKASLYNILIMEELCSILAMGGGGSTKLVDASGGRVRRVFDPKYPLEYINSMEKILTDKEKITEFYTE